jgi:hypothetical protein
MPWNGRFLEAWWDNPLLKISRVHGLCNRALMVQARMTATLEVSKYLFDADWGCLVLRGKYRESRVRAPGMKFNDIARRFTGDFLALIPLLSCWRNFHDSTKGSKSNCFNHITSHLASHSARYIIPSLACHSSSSPSFEVFRFTLSS